VENVGSAPGRDSASGLFCLVGPTILGRPRASRDARPYPRPLGQHAVLPLPQGGEGEVGDEPGPEGGGDFTRNYAQRGRRINTARG